MMMAAGAAAGLQPQKKTSFDVELTACGDNKIGVIKSCTRSHRSWTQEAKDLVDGAPKVVKKVCPKDQAEEMKKKLTNAGGTAVIK